MSPLPANRRVDQPPLGHRNTINHDEHALCRFLDELDAKSNGNKSPRRMYVRWPYRVAAVRMTIYHPSGNPTDIYVACRNLSAGGIGVLHRSYLHKGTAVSVDLPKIDGEVAGVEGVVVRCNHVSGTIHDLGIKFNVPVSARDFVRLDPFADGFSLERVNPEDLKGNLLYIQDSTLDQSLVRHFLRETQLRLQFAMTLEEAKKKAADGVDLILCEHNLGEADDGAAIARALREAGVSTPIIMLTADTSTTTRVKLIDAQANAFLAKPLQQSMLFRAIAEFMLSGACGAGSLTSSLPASHPNRKLLPTFGEQIRDYMRSLDGAMKEGNATRCRSICLQIAGAAPVMGFEKLADVARASEKALSASMSVEESKGALATLITACQRVNAKG